MAYTFEHWYAVVTELQGKIGRLESKVKNHPDSVYLKTLVNQLRCEWTEETIGKGN